MSLLILFVGLAVGVSFVCSLLEAALLSSRNVTLAHQRDQGSRGAGMLLKLKQTRVDDAISAILTLNTVANTLGATLAGAQAAKVFGSNWVGVFSGALTFLILVVSEIIPKTLGAVYARRLSGIVGWTLQLLTKAMTPALIVSRLLTRLLTRGHAPTLSRGELATTIATAAHHAPHRRRDASHRRDHCRSAGRWRSRDGQPHPLVSGQSGQCGRLRTAARDPEENR